MNKLFLSSKYGNWWCRKKFLKLMNFYKKRLRSMFGFKQKRGDLLKDLDKNIQIINLDIDRTYKSIFLLKRKLYQINLIFFFLA